MGDSEQDPPADLRGQLACASLHCHFRVHSRPELRGFCCVECSRGRAARHGPRCQQVLAPVRARRADPSWLPIAGEMLAARELEDALRTLAPQLALEGPERQPEPILGGGLSFSNFLDVPLNHDEVGGEGARIQVFFREVILAEHLTKRFDLPVLLCLPAGLGIPATRPTNCQDGWLGCALRKHRVVLMDPRGTGRSSRVAPQTLRGRTAKEQAFYVQHFRADAVAGDCEAVRRRLGVEQLAVLGEDFGSLVALTFLSRFPRSVRQLFLCDGLMLAEVEGPEDICHRMYRCALRGNRWYYSRYPEDVGKVREIVAHLEQIGGVPLADGGRLTPRRFLTLGSLLGDLTGPEVLHWLVSRAFVELRCGSVQLSTEFVTEAARATDVGAHPLLWLLGEPTYCGPRTGASRWAAHRMMSYGCLCERFDYRDALKRNEKPPILFTGETVYPWFADDMATLASLADASEILASKVDWPPLLDVAKICDARVPITAVVDASDVRLGVGPYPLQISKMLGDTCRALTLEELHQQGLTEGVLDLLFTCCSSFGESRIRVVSGGNDHEFRDRVAHPLRRFTKAEMEETALRHVRHSVGEGPGWHQMYQAFQARVRLGADEDILPGGALCSGHTLRVPLDHAQPSGEHISIFFRQVVSAADAKSEALATASGRQAPPPPPRLLVLVGGPGAPAPRPLSGSEGWLSPLLHDHRVILLDQRGTGKSTPASAQTLQGWTPEEQAAYLENFRADSIVEDCEDIRRFLEVDQWSLLGESFGGFCALTYVSKHPARISAAYLTGGLPPVFSAGPDEVYRHTYQRAIARNQLYYARYPADVAKIRAIVQHLEDKGGVPLPSQGRLTPRRFQLFGAYMGSEFGSEALHVLVEDPFVHVGGEAELDDLFLARVEAGLVFDVQPLYWLLHEAIYCGPRSGPSNWSAQRVLSADPQLLAHFDHRAALADPSAPPVFLTGEMVYPWFSEDFAGLQSLGPAAQRLAAKTDWTALYDLEVLRNTTVPVASHIDSEDIYVDVGLSKATAKLLGARCKVWVLDECRHSCLSDGTGAMLKKLLSMVRPEISGAAPQRHSAPAPGTSSASDGMLRGEVWRPRTPVVVSETGHLLPGLRPRFR